LYRKGGEQGGPPRYDSDRRSNSPKSLTRLTSRTITDPKKLLSELARVKKRGVAFSCGERVMDGLCAISGPFSIPTGEVHYCLTVTLTPFRLQVKGREKLFNLVKEAAKAISQKMGAPVIKSKSNSARELREIYNGSDKRI